MANSVENTPDLDYDDKLRGTVDAAEYKHVVLGLCGNMQRSKESRRMNR